MLELNWEHLFYQKGACQEGWNVEKGCWSEPRVRRNVHVPFTLRQTVPGVGLFPLYVTAHPVANSFSPLSR